ncbi:hypothetical protein T4E_7586 [Trichinella pseudospiralis]|uniref:Uncharacterized protein n=1 Tax=Trichinella pseudospiralis TaxID=6337 RepID=A0A0V0Y9P5_TRIPS|nr:hypothetical protein T4E_7586 [Trichinella pseudospiralis]
MDTDMGSALCKKTSPSTSGPALYSLASSEDLCRAVAGINCPQLRELRKSVNNNNTSERDADGIDHFSLSDRFRLNLYGSF